MKLIELFEAIPMTVEISEDADGERILQLTDSERLAVLADQVSIIPNFRCRAGEKAFIYPPKYGTIHIPLTMRL
jgi:hypothetical protein